MCCQAARSLVIVIESNMRLAHSISLLLDDWGFDALVAPSPEAAAGELGDRRGRVAAVLVDELAAYSEAVAAVALLAERIGYQVPALVISGRQPAAAGGDELPVLEKPFDPQVLQRWLEAHA